MYRYTFLKCHLNFRLQTWLCTFPEITVNKLTQSNSHKNTQFNQQQSPTVRPVLIDCFDISASQRLGTAAVSHYYSRIPPGGDHRFDSIDYAGHHQPRCGTQLKVM